MVMREYAAQQLQRPEVAQNETRQGVLV